MLARKGLGSDFIGIRTFTNVTIPQEIKEVRNVEVITLISV